MLIFPEGGVVWNLPYLLHGVLEELSCEKCLNFFTEVNYLLMHSRNLFMTLLSTFSMCDQWATVPLLNDNLVMIDGQCSSLCVYIGHYFDDSSLHVQT